MNKKEFEIQKIELPLEGKGGLWRIMKNRRTRFMNSLLSISGVTEELLGPHHPEHSKKEDPEIFE